MKVSINLRKPIVHKPISILWGFILQKFRRKEKGSNVDTVLKITIENDSLPIAFKHESYT